MRVSTVIMFERSVSSMNRQQSQFMEIGEKIASGKRVVRPSDDPQAAARAVGVSQSMATNNQQSDSRITARNALSQEESALNSVTDALSRAKELLVQGGNGTLNDAARQSMASELRGVYEALVGQANATDGSGNYLFGGYKDGAAPFVDTNGSISYQGAAEGREQKVGPSRLMAVGNTGDEVFQRVATGAQQIARASSSNQGTLTFSGPSVVNSSAARFGETFSVTFDVDSEGEITYQAYDNDGNLTARQYEPGKAVVLNGVRIAFDGTPRDGDRVTVGPASDADPDVFRSLENMLNALETPIDSDQARAAFTNTLSTTSREMDNALDNVLTVRASVGARLNELDVLDTVGNDRNVAYTQTKSDLIDLDYNSAVSEYVLRQVGLQAAQKSFMNLQGTSLFDLV